MPVSCRVPGQKVAQVLQVDGAFPASRIRQNVANQRQIAYLSDEVSNRTFNARYREATDNNNVPWVQLSMRVSDVQALCLATLAGNHPVGSWFDVAGLMNGGGGGGTHHDGRIVEPLPGKHLRESGHPGRTKIIKRPSGNASEPIHAMSEAF